MDVNDNAGIQTASVIVDVHREQASLLQMKRCDLSFMEHPEPWSLII
jgi:hypothetical protein